MASPIGSSGSISACHTVLMGRDLAKTIFSYLLADQKAATRNLRRGEVQIVGVLSAMDSRKPRGAENGIKDFKTLRKIENPEKEQNDARELKEGTRNMEVLRSVCRAWSKIILDDKDLHFFLVFTRAKRIFVEHVKEYGLSGDNSCRAVCQIARVELLWDPVSALSTLKWITDSEKVDDELVQFVRKAVSIKDLATAKTAANAIETVDKKITALCEIAKIDPQVLQEAKNLVPQFGEGQDSMLLEIAKAEALQNDFTSALITANGMRSGKIEAFVELAKIGSQHNLEAVKAWACQIEDSKIQALVQFEIAIIERDPINAIGWVDYINAQQIWGDAQIAQAYIKIAKLDRSQAYAKATKFINFLTPGYEKVKLLIEVAKLDEIPNFAEAKQEAALAPVSPFPNTGYFNVEENNDLVVNHQFRLNALGPDYLFHIIALAEAKYNVEVAKATADKIIDPAQKTKTKYEIAMVRLLDIDAAREAASQFSNPSEQAFAFIEIARKNPLHDLFEAKDLACRIKGYRDRKYTAVFEKVSAICAIARIVKGDYT